MDEILNKKPNKSMAYVGGSAFSHKGGLHVSAVKKIQKRMNILTLKMSETIEILLFLIKPGDQT